MTNTPVKAIFFDTFNTVYAMDRCRRDEIEAYAAHIAKPDWSPLNLPERWSKLPAWNDVIKALPSLRDEFICVALSNGPIDVQIALARNSRLDWDFIVPLEAYHVFKPNVRAYQVAVDLVGVHPSEAMMVTANRDFGDLEGAASCGMQSMWIDRKHEAAGYPNDFRGLLERLKT